MSAFSIGLAKSGPAFDLQREKWVQFLKCLGLFGITCLCWGMVPILAKAASLEGVHPVAISLQINLFGAAILLSYCACLKRMRLPRRNELPFFVLFALLSVLVNQLLVFWLSGKIGAVNVAIVTVLEGFCIAIFALVTRLESAGLKRLAGIALGFIGTMLIFYDGLSGFSALPIFVMASAMLVPITYATESLMIAQRPEGMCDHSCLGLVMLTSLPFLALSSWFGFGRGIEGTIWQAIDLTPVGMVFILVSLFGNLSYFALVRNGGTLFAGQSSYGITLVGVVFGALLFGEPIASQFILALVLVFSGLFLVGIKSAKKV